MPSALTTGLGYGLGGLAGMGLVLQQIQEDLAHQAQAQIAARQGQGTWEPTPAPDRSFFQKLFGGGIPADMVQLGGGKYAQFKPYPGMTAADLTSLGLTTTETASPFRALGVVPPETPTTPQPSGLGGNLSPAQTVERPIAPLLGLPKSPQNMQAFGLRLLQEANKLKELKAKQAFEQRQQQEMLQGLETFKRQQLAGAGAPGMAPGTTPGPVSPSMPTMPMAPRPALPATPGPADAGAAPAPAAAVPALAQLPGLPPARVPTAQTVVAEAQKQGVDPALALAVAYQESSMDPNAKNPQGESRGAGLFGFIPSTGKARGMWEQRYDPQVSAQHGIGYLKELMAAHPGDLRAALRAYGGADAPEGNKKYDTEVMARYETYKKALAQAAPAQAASAAVAPAAGPAAAPPVEGAPARPTPVPTAGLQPAVFQQVQPDLQQFTEGTVSTDQLIARLKQAGVANPPQVIEEYSRAELGRVDQALAANAKQIQEHQGMLQRIGPLEKTNKTAAGIADTEKTIIGQLEKHQTQLGQQRATILHALEKAQVKADTLAEKAKDKAEALKGSATTEQNAFAVQLYNQGLIASPDYHGAGNTPAHKQQVNDAIRTYKTGQDRQKAEDKKRTDLELAGEKEQMKEIPPTLQGRIFDPEGNPDRSIVTHRDLTEARKAGKALVLSPKEADEMRVVGALRVYMRGARDLIDKVTGPGGVLAGFGTQYGRDPAYWKTRAADINNDAEYQSLKQALVELRTRGAQILEGLKGRPAYALLKPEIDAGPTMEGDFWGMITGGLAGKLPDLPKTIRAKIDRMDRLNEGIAQEVMYGSKKPPAAATPAQEPKASTKELDAPTATTFLQRARHELFPAKLTGPLTSEEQQAVRDRAKVLLQQEGYAP